LRALVDLPQAVDLLRGARDHLGERRRLGCLHPSPGLLELHQPRTEGEERLHLGEFLLRAPKELQLIRDARIEQDVIDPPLLAQLSEVERAQARLPAGIELPHPCAPGIGVLDLITAAECRAVRGVARDDVGELARRPRNEGIERRECSRRRRHRRRDWCDGLRPRHLGASERRESEQGESAQDDPRGGGEVV
jgi:hypothetical protein